MIRIGAVLFILILATACGQKGTLVLPGDQDKPQKQERKK